VPKKKGFTICSWLIILGFIGFLTVRSRFQEGPGETEQQERLQNIAFELQARYLIGASNFFAGNAKEFYEQAKGLNRGSLGQRLRFVVFAGELAGPEEALSQALDLHEILQRLPDTEGKNAVQRKLATLLVNLYRDYVAGNQRASSVSEADRAFLRTQLPWFGDLALNPRADVKLHPGLAAACGPAPALVLEQGPIDPAKRDEILAPAFTTLCTVLGAAGSFCFLGLIGFVGLVIFLIFLAGRKLNGGLACGSSEGGVYAETFALYLFLFIGLGFWFQFVPWEVPTLVKASLASLGSLVVLGWPVLRGISWTQVRQDIGWTLGRKPALEPALGLVCYVLALPIVLIGLILTLMLMALQKQLGGLGLGALAQNQPIHPIVEFIVNGSTMDRSLVLVLACVLAPLVEETMFRGVLYRHLREVSHRWGWLWSVVFSGTVVSFLFAVIHPQGIVAVPALMALAYGFTIAREWRGSLIPSMVGHAFNNGVVMVIVFLVLGG
jgi:membrane protease YdiL (CAAX protease family)